MYLQSLMANFSPVRPEEQTGAIEQTFWRAVDTIPKHVCRILTLFALD